MITRVSGVIRPKGSDLVFDHPLAVLHTNGAINLCDIGPHPDVVEIGSHGPVTSPCITFSADGARLATSGDHTVKVWHL
jgi:hypothetical protein